MAVGKATIYEFIFSNEEMRNIKYLIEYAIENKNKINENRFNKPYIDVCVLEQVYKEAFKELR